MDEAVGVRLAICHIESIDEITPERCYLNRRFQNYQEHETPSPSPLHLYLDAIDDFGGL